MDDRGVLRSVRRRATALAAVTLLLAGACAQGSSATTTTPPTGIPASPTPAVSPTPPASPESTPSLTPGAPSGIELVSVDLPRDPASPTEADAAGAAIDAFGLDLLRAAADPTKNIVLSPASVAIALSMARLGAVGPTAAEMDSVLHDLVAGGDIGPIDSLDQALAGRSGTFPDRSGTDHDVLLRLTNATFVQRDLTLETAYLEGLAKGFGSGVRTVDFGADPAAARSLINDWVADQTEDRIAELLSPGDVSVLTRLVLVNAIYLKAPWQEPFDEAFTGPADFTLVEGSRIQVPTMATQRSLAYAAGDGWRAVELPYLGGELAMTIIVPDDLAAFIASLSAERFDAITSGLAPRPVALTLPRFGFDTHTDLAGLLAGLGMPLAFSDRADFSGITRDLPLAISAVIHEANIDVDEKGTEAAAATAVVMDALTGPVAPPEPVTVHVDRPFLFAIRDLGTGAMVFLGQVVDPSAGSA